MESNEERYRRKAEECREHASIATDDADRNAWLELAEDWLKLARSIERQGAGEIRE
jgi:hypothetical protein